MNIRLARTEDLEDVVALSVALWPHAANEEHREEIRAILSGSPRSTLPLVIFVAQTEDALIGFVEVGLRSHADGCDPRRPVGFIEGWYVAPEHQRRGVGRALIERAEQWAREQGCIELASDTWIDNVGSQQAHDALGFEETDRCVNYRKSIGGSG